MINKVTSDNLDEWISYHVPTEKNIQDLQELREQARSFAYAIITICPDCADTSAALRLLKQTLMTANQSIILEPF